MTRPAARPRRATSGFTLVEMLAALAVLALLTAAVAAGVTAGLGIYRQSTFESRSELLSGTIDNALSDPFRFMTYNEDTGRYTIVYRDDSSNAIVDSSPRLVAEGGVLYLEGTDGDGAQLRLKVLNSGAYGSCEIAVTSFECTPSSVSGGYTITDETDPSLSRSFTFCYAPVAATKVVS